MRSHEVGNPLALTQMVAGHGQGVVVVVVVVVVVEVVVVVVVVVGGQVPAAMVTVVGAEVQRIGGTCVAVHGPLQFIVGSTLAR